MVSQKNRFGFSSPSEAIDVIPELILRWCDENEKHASWILVTSHNHFVMGWNGKSSTKHLFEMCWISAIITDLARNKVLACNPPLLSPSLLRGYTKSRVF
jgi:hypothetical protein